MTACATRLENLPRRIQIDAHAEVEIRFGLAAHDGREMKHRRDVSVDRMFDELAVRNVSGQRADSGVAKRVGRRQIDEGQSVDWCGPAV